VCIPFFWTTALQLFFPMYQVCSEVSSTQTHHEVTEVLESSHQDDLRKAIELAWKFVTLPNPLIVCQPTGFNSRLHDPEGDYWDSEHANKSKLVYTRPVVYRNYEGVLACKGWVANTATSQHSDRRCSLC